MKSTYRKAISSTFLKCCAAAAVLGAALTGARADYPAGVLAQNPLLYFRLNESVTPLFDVATNTGTDGTGDNGFYVGMVHGATGIPGASGDKAATDPNTDNSGGNRVRVPYSAVLNQVGAFTAEFWTRPGGGSSCPFNSVDFTASTRTGWLIYQDTIVSGQWTFRVYKTGGANVQISGGAVSQGVWHHVVGVLDSNTNLSLYVDGVLAAGPTALGADQTPVVNTAIPLSIGARGDGAAGFFGYTGDLDEAVYYTNALTSSQILAHYQAGTNAATANYSSQISSLHPAGYWRLNETGPARVTAVNSGTLGNSGNGTYYDATTTVPGPRPSPDGLPGFDSGNNAPSFDGTSGYVRIPQGTNNLSGAGLTNVTEATFFCWLNPNGLPTGYEGLLAMRPLSTGLYMQNDGSLNYSWLDNANTYNFNSGLIPPAFQWSMAAVVVHPDYAMFYLGTTNGGGTFLTASNGVSHPAADFTSGPFAIARDINFGGSGRFFNGAIDEAAVYTKALSSGYLQSLFFTAIGSNAAPFMVEDPPTQNPAGTVYATTTFSLTADVAGALPLTYQWRTNGVAIPGATSYTYTRANASANDNGNYDIVVTNSFGSITSMVVSITVNPAVPASVTTPPQPRTVFQGGIASFTLGVDGTAPFTFQWRTNGVAIAGATNQTLVITNVSSANAATYTVAVTNVAGGIISAGAALTVVSPAAGSYAQSVMTNGPINYWRLDETSGNTAFDWVGGLDGVYSNGVTLGVAGGLPFGGADTAVEFDGSSGQIVLNGSGVQPPWTAIFWAKRTDTGGTIQPSAALIDDRIAPVSSSLRLEQWQNSGVAGISHYGVGDFYYTYAPPGDTWVQLVYVGFSNRTDLYVNGTLTDSSPNGIQLPRRKIGSSTTTDYLKAQLDEVSLFNKALPASTIATIYASGEYGNSSPPVILQPPVATTVVVGTPATFSVVAGGSLPLSYQWKVGGTPIPGATSSTFTIPSAYFTDAGNYSVTVSNNVTSTPGSGVALTVMPAPTFANATNGLVLHLKFDGDFGDTSGRGNHASPGNSPAFVPGKIGSQAVQVSTVSGSSIYNYVQVLNTNTSVPYPDLQFTNVDSFTVAYWAKYTGLPNDLPIIGNSINSTYQPGWVLTDDTGKLDWTLTTVSGSGQVIADPVPGSPTINNGVWHHTLVSFDRTSATANTYIDGALVDTRSIAAIGSLDLGTGVFIGQDPTGAYGVDGTYAVDDVGIWRRALNGYEALSVYNAGQNSNESFDVPGPVKLSIYLVGNNIDVAWQAGTLYQAPSVNGPWSPVSGATAPFYRTTTTGGPKFFRVPPQ